MIKRLKLTRDDVRGRGGDRGGDPLCVCDRYDAYGRVCGTKKKVLGRCSKGSVRWTSK